MDSDTCDPETHVTGKSTAGMDGHRDDGEPAKRNKSDGAAKPERGENGAPSSSSSCSQKEEEGDEATSKTADGSFSDQDDMFEDGGACDDFDSSSSLFDREKDSEPRVPGILVGVSNLLPLPHWIPRRRVPAQSEMPPRPTTNVGIIFGVPPKKRPECRWGRKLPCYSRPKIGKRKRRI